MTWMVLGLLAIGVWAAVARTTWVWRLVVAIQAAGLAVVLLALAVLGLRGRPRTARQDRSRHAILAVLLAVLGFLSARIARNGLPPAPAGVSVRQDAPPPSR